MSITCTVCRGINLRITTAEDMKFKCLRCAAITEPTPSDTIVYDSNKSGMSYQSILQNIADDPINQYIPLDCKKCPSKYSKFTVIGDDLLRVSQCVVCHNITRI